MINKIKALYYRLTKQSCEGCQYLTDVLYTHPMCNNCKRCYMIQDNYSK